MGLLKHLLFWPVTGPAFLTRYSLQQIDAAARRERMDEGPILEEMLALQMSLEAGDIDEDAYLVEEGRLVERLREARAWRREYGES
jgi:hypothetical protein